MWKAGVMLRPQVAYELDPRTTEVTEISFLLDMGTISSKDIGGKVSYNLSQGNNFALQLNLSHLGNTQAAEIPSVTHTVSAFSYKSLLPQARSWEYSKSQSWLGPRLAIVGTPAALRDLHFSSVGEATEMVHHFGLGLIPKKSQCPAFLLKTMVLFMGAQTHHGDHISDILHCRCFYYNS